jgi:hypothetical protein
MSPSNFGSSRSAKRSTEWKYNDSCLSLGVMYTGEKITCDSMSFVQQSVNKTFHRYLPNFIEIVLLITLNIRIKICVFQS